MRLPSFKRLFTSDFPKENQPVMEKLAFIINNGIEVLYQALNNKLTFQDNFFADVKDINVTVGNVDGTLKQPAAINLTNLVNSTVAGAFVIKATNLTNPGIYPTGGINVAFSQSGNTINITNVTGLPVNNTFSIKVVFIGT